MGAGVAAKAVAPTLISLQVFALTQVLIDIEPAVRMAQGDDVLHGWTHTLPGAVPVAILSAVAWKLLEGRRIWRWTFERISAPMLWTTVLVGAFSHVLLDSLIHHDMASTRAILNLDLPKLLSHEAVQVACMAAAAGGALVLAARLGWTGFTQLFKGIGFNLSRAPAWFRRADQ